MAITKDKKTEILGKLKDVAKKDAIIFVNFHGLNVAQSSEIRKKLRESGVSYLVAKKTLVKKAFTEEKISGDLPSLDGELAVVASDDATAPAREIFAFQKTFSGAISILGGVFENKFISKSEAEEIAKIPSLQVLRGMFVNVINSPIQGLAIVTQAIADKKSA
jgi:large subunit ribosomal protein L10